MSFLRVLIVLLLLAVPAFAQEPETRTALFAGGNFWSLQYAFDRTPGITNTVTGYTGGRIANPGYKQVADGSSGHRMGLLVTYDPARISYAQLLDVFWHNIDPMDGAGQFCDRGMPYTSVIYFDTPDQLQIAADSKMLLEADAESMGGQAITTVILKAQAFYPAESYHQQYYRRNPLRFRYWERTCGRAQRLHAVWGR